MTPSRGFATRVEGKKSPAVPGPGLQGGPLGEHIQSGAGCSPTWGSELRWAQPELQSPLLGNKHPRDSAKQGALWFASLGWGAPRARWRWLFCGSCSPREAEGWRGGRLPQLCRSALLGGAGASTPLPPSNPTELGRWDGAAAAPGWLR